MRRELNEIEYFNWCFGQPYNMVASVQLRGELRPEALRRALDKAQARHPMLRVNTEIDSDRRLPWFSSGGVGAIPLNVVEGAEPGAASKLTESELASRFVMNEPGSARLPLVRVSLLLPRDPEQPTDLVITVQHIIADGLSIVFLVRDLLHSMDEPHAELVVLDAPASDAELMPPKVRRWIPRSRLRFTIALALAKLYVWLRFGNRPEPPKQLRQHSRAWELSAAQTKRLRERCRREGVSVQSAICTAFIPAFGTIHTPVSLRSFLARPVGESVGLFVGSADVGMKYRAARGFWSNARRFHHRLRRALRNPFRIFQLFSKAVPPELMAQLGSAMMKIAVSTRPFAVTNLRELDGAGLDLRSKSLKIESFSGAVTGIIESSVLTVYTIDGRMHLHLLASELVSAETAVRDDAERAVKLLLDSVGLPVAQADAERGLGAMDEHIDMAARQP